MYTNRVSHQRNIIQLHSYIEYFSRNSPCFVLPPTIPFDDAKFSGKLVDMHRMSEMCNVDKSVRFVNVVQKMKYHAEGRQFRLFESHFENRTPIARVAVFQGCNFVDNSRKTYGWTEWKVGQFETRIVPIEVSLILSIIIHSDLLATLMISVNVPMSRTKFVSITAVFRSYVNDISHFLFLPNE